MTSRISHDKALEIAREVIPDMPDNILTAILWLHTSYPCWFAGEPESTLRQELTDHIESNKA